MNLIAKTTLLYLFVASLVFGAGGVVAYVLVQQEVQKETDFALYDNMLQLTEELADSIPLYILKRGKVDIYDLGSEVRDTFYQFSDTLAPHPYREGQMEPFRKISAVQLVNGRYYKISITDVIIETDDIYDVVVKIMLRLFIILGLAMIVFSFIITRLLFRPFQKTLSQIRAFRLKESDPLRLPNTSTKEFRQLHVFLEEMTAKAKRDYLAMKEFSENASHEIQTPLAIAQGKLELLMETPNLSDEQLQLTEAIQQSIARLSKLGKALLLLTKIDNQEFSPQKPIDFSQIGQSCLDNFSELADLKGLRMHVQIEPNVLLAVNPVLADVLVSNLLKNAIRYNEPNGWIELELNQYHLLVRNPGKEPSVPTERLFDRFQKSQPTYGSLGLGLAIVKKIAEASGMKVNYIFNSGIHQLQVVFPSAKA
ncbi:MAG TPA: HAMP domain-containing sensor histidine kinase [Saprospiraceae bacterium]|nr:HAMP domain-containing sensor histidine kinase [Saprospiraceae bacterium]HMQ82696.1 HAMP domain-containing sensor histidine kinase [Saprospiraceae bacterium]